MQEKKSTKSEAQKVFLGVDGYRKGWLIAILGLEKELIWTSISRIDEIEDLPVQAFLCLIDIPIGLSDSGYRTCDRLGRRMLGNRASSIFLIPARSVVYCDDYFEACTRNLWMQGKKISWQVFNLFPKIREVDLFLRERPEWCSVIWESHPELCFKIINGGRRLESKHSPVGIQQRIRILKRWIPDFETMMGHYQKKITGARPDDFIDSAVLAYVASFTFEGLNCIPTHLEMDAFGLRMNILVPR